MDALRQDIHIPKGVYCLLVLGLVLKFTRFLFAKTSANKRFFIMSAHPNWVCGCKGSEIFWIEQEKSLIRAIFSCVEGKGGRYLPDHWQIQIRWRRLVALEVLAALDNRMIFVKYPKTPRAFSGTRMRLLFRV